jgi:hypothetical protein
MLSPAISPRAVRLPALDNRRRRPARLLCAATAALGWLWAGPSGPAAAGADGGGGTLQLGWNGVRDSEMSSARSFGCDTIGGSHRMVLTFTAPDSVTQFVALDVVLELRATGQRLPAWWEFRNSNACRTLSLSLHMGPVATGAEGEVPDPWDQGQTGLGVITAYERDIGGDLRLARISASLARPMTTPIALAPGRLYRAATFVMDHRRTLGRYACEGCREPITIQVRKLTLLEASGRSTVIAPGLDGCLGWQGASCQAEDAGRGEADE